MRNCSRNSSSFVAYTNTSSRYNSTKMYNNPASTLLAIMRYKYDAAPFNPMGRRHHWNRPVDIMNAVKGRDLSSMAVWKNPDVISTLPKRRGRCCVALSIIIGMFCRGQVSMNSVASFRFLKSMQSRHVWSGLRTRCT
jgi:hypothetical protein